MAAAEAGHDPEHKPSSRRLPYAPYPRLVEALGNLESSSLIGNPPRLAEAAFEELAPSTREQLEIALRALGLLGVDRMAPTELVRIARGREDKVLRDVLRRRVESVLAEPVRLIRAGEPPHEVDAWITAQGYSGDTVRRVRSFMLAAIEDLGIEADLRPFRVRSRRQASTISSESRAAYAHSQGTAANWREVRADEYASVLIRYLSNRLRGTPDDEAARGLEWLLDRIERVLGPASSREGEDREFGR